MKLFPACRLGLIGCLMLIAPVGTQAARAAVPLPDDDPFYAVPANLDAVAGGTILRSREITPTAMSVPMPARGWQLLYKTIDNTGHATATVATVMVPTAPWTAAGPRPVVSYQTAEDGVGTKCSPSYAIRAGLGGGLSNSTPETLLMLQALLRGWTVIAPDYEGPHSMFLGSEGEARGVLDGLRAARAFKPAGIDPTAPLGMWGYSGGAFATSVAAQLQPRYAPELKLSGIALGGVVGSVRATIKAFSGSVEGGALVMGFVAVDRSYPAFHLTHYLNDAARKAMAASQTDCITDAVARNPGARMEQYTDDPAVLDSPALTPLFQQMDPLSFPGVPAAPVYDYHAVLDELAPIGPDRALMTRFCRGGVPVQKVEDMTSEHISLVATGWPGALDYLAARFAGEPAPNNCKVPDQAAAGTGSHASPLTGTVTRKSGSRRAVIRLSRSITGAPANIRLTAGGRTLATGTLQGRTLRVVVRTGARLRGSCTLRPLHGNPRALTRLTLR